MQRWCGGRSRKDPEQGKALVRLFEIYALGYRTLGEVAEQLHQEGHYYSQSMPRFPQSVISYILNNRFYVGEVRRNGQVFQGKYRLLIDRVTFEACQAVFHARDHRTGSPNLPFSGGLSRCAFCGQGITGEVIRRRLRDGTVRDHMYCRRANNRPGPDHPVVRWRGKDLEAASPGLSLPDHTVLATNSRSTASQVSLPSADGARD